MFANQTVPTPKLSRLSACVKWYPFYAMFSEQFARAVIDSAKLSAGSTILDPWLGVGTTIAVAAKCGHHAIGRDINPAMAVISRGRFAKSADAQYATDKVWQSISKKSVAISHVDPLLNWFAPQAAQELRNWQRALDRNISISADARDFVFTCLFDAAKVISRKSQSKNPTWRKRLPKKECSRVSAATVRKLIIADASRRYDLLPSTTYVCPDIGLGCSTQINCKSESIDFILTSPPYCTRIDYAVTTQIELAILGYSDCSLRSLRDASMGTSTIRGQMVLSDQSEWGKYCNGLLNSIKEHKSKASQTYYLKTFLQYFSDLFNSLVEIRRTLKPSGRLAIVVQDSYYKEVRIDLALVVKQMCEHLDFTWIDQLDFMASRTMRGVNSKSRKYNSQVGGIESVICFQKC